MSFILKENIEKNCEFYKKCIYVLGSMSADKSSIKIFVCSQPVTRSRQRMT